MEGVMVTGREAGRGGNGDWQRVTGKGNWQGEVVGG